MAARSSLLRRPTPGARPARRTSSVVAALAALAPRLVRLARHDYPDGLLASPMRHVISILVENEFGVLARVAGLFSGRGFNIESLSVAETMDPTVSRITLVTRGDDQVLEQIEKQLYKLIAVVKLTDFTGTEHVERELVLIKIDAEERTRGEVMNIVDIFRGKIS